MNPLTKASKPWPCCFSFHQKSTTNWKKTGTHPILSSKEFAPSSSGITKTSNGFPYKDLSIRNQIQRKKVMLIRGNHHLHLYLLPKSSHKRAWKRDKRRKAWRCYWGFQKITIYFWKKTPNQMMIFCVVFVDFSIGITMKSCKNCEPEITHFIVRPARHYLLMRCGWMKSREVSQNFRKFKHRSH